VKTFDQEGYREGFDFAHRVAKNGPMSKLWQQLRFRPVPGIDYAPIVRVTLNGPWMAYRLDHQQARRTIVCRSPNKTHV
jgi:hypothetical protein